jgi:hypothetical protein
VKAYDGRNKGIIGVGSLDQVVDGHDDWIISIGLRFDFQSKPGEERNNNAYPAASSSWVSTGRS